MLSGVGRSSTKRPWPRSRYSSSRRSTLCPTAPFCVAAHAAVPPSQLHCGLGHRVDDVGVAGAATDVVHQCLPDGGLVGVGSALQQLNCGQEEARRAESALQRMLLMEHLLDRM